MKFLKTLLLVILFAGPAFAQTWSPLGGGTGWERALAVYNGELYAGGNFGILRWDGAAWQSVGGGVTGEVWDLCVYNGKLIVGGSFTNAGNTGTPFLDQWDGSTWTDLGSAPNSIVSSLAVYGTKLIIGGYFTQCENLPTNHIVQYEGDQFSVMGTGTGGSQGQVMALTTYGSNLIAGGFFSTAGGNPANRIAQWNGTSWSPLGSGIGGIVYALTTYNGNLIAGGLFSSAGGISASDVAEWNGSSWSALGTGCGGGTYPYVFAFETYANDLYVAGMYTIAGGQTCNGIAKWNGSTWSPLGSGFWNGGSNAYGAYAACIYNNDLICGGIFSSAGGNGAGNVAKWDGLSLTGMSNQNSAPRDFALFQNYPNPFNPSTVISFDLPKESNVRLNVFDISGRLVSNVIDEKLKSGRHEFRFDARNLSSGTYFYRIETESFTETRKMILIR